MRLLDRSEIYRRFFNGGNGSATIHVSDIDTIPDIDATPIVHGRWESHLLPMAWKCSVCGRRMGYNAWKYKYMNYCPMCGAKMDLDDGKA